MDWEVFQEISDAGQLVTHVKYALGLGRKPRRFSPRVSAFLAEYFKTYTLSDFLREFSLRTLEKPLRALLEGLNLEGFTLFPADLIPGILYAAEVKAYPANLTPFHELLKLAGMVEKTEKCIIVLGGALDVEVSTGIKKKMNTARARLLKKCREIILIGGVRDEKHILRQKFKVKLAKSTGKRKDGSFLFVVWFSPQGSISPKSVPARLSGEILQRLSEIWKPLAERFQVVRYLPPGKERVLADVITTSSIENGKISGALVKRYVSKKTLLGKGDVIVAVKGKSVKAGVIESEGKYSIDPNTIGIKISDVETARALAFYINFPVIKEALEENICYLTDPPFLSEPLLMSLPVPENIIEIVEKLKEIYKNYLKVLQNAKEDLKEEFEDMLSRVKSYP